MKVFLILLVLLVTIPAHAEDAPMVRVKIEHAGQVYVGQSFRIDVTVLVPNYFLSSPSFPIFDLPGAVVTMPSEGGTNVTETIGQTTYAGIQRSYVIVPQQTGTFRLPPAVITFKYAAVPGKPSEGSVSLPPETFEVTLPPGAATDQGALPVGRITIAQRVTDIPGQLHVGDAITRTVEITAEHMQSMMIPPPVFTAPDGVRIYHKDPQLTELKGDQGEFLGGRRTDAVTYVFEQAGDFTLPAISVDWFDPAKGSKQVATAPAIPVAVAVAPTSQTAIAPDAPPAEKAPETTVVEWLLRTGPALAVLMGLVVAAWLGRRLSKRIRSFLTMRRRVRLESEDAYFSRLLDACRSNDPVRSYNALSAWVRKSGHVSITDYLQTVADTRLHEQVAALDKHLFSPSTQPGQWSGAALGKALMATRRSAAQRTRHSRNRLSTLNPTDA